MGDDPQLKWFLLENGKKTGPHTIEQIRTLFQDGKVQPSQKATADRLQGQWISVQELVNSYADPALNLLETLRVTRERQILAQAPLPSPPHARRIPIRVWFALGWAVVLGLLAWLISYSLNQGSSLPETPEPSQTAPSFSTPPPAPIHPLAPPPLPDAALQHPNIQPAPPPAPPPANTN